MSNNTAFQAKGKTYKANANTTSQSFQILSDAPCNQICVSNHGNPASAQPVYFTFGNSSVTVTAPTGGGASSSYALISVPGTTKVYTVPKQFDSTSGLYIAFITEATSGEAYFTPGEGI